MTERAFPLAVLLPVVPDAARTRELARALDVRRNAAIGFGSGLVVATLAYAFRVGELAGANPDTRGSPAMFLLLAFVLAVTVGLLVSAVLTIRSAIRLAGEVRGADGGEEGTGEGGDGSTAEDGSGDRLDRAGSQE